MSVVRNRRRVLERQLEGVCMLLMVGLAGVVMLAVAYRCGGASLVWYDEVAAIMLVRLTYLWRRARLAETHSVSYRSSRSPW